MAYRLCYFNSQPHEEADIIKKFTALYFHISTHSLTRRLTTTGKVPAWLYFVISTHSLTRRLTSCNGNGKMGYGNFNSQPHEEADGVTKNLDMGY